MCISIMYVSHVVILLPYEKLFTQRKQYILVKHILYSGQVTFTLVFKRNR